MSATSIIDASPTKNLFIDLLTRDIGLIPAILDLIDNSADGARKIRGDRNFQGLWARIEITASSFKISDNCGGISVETAQKYAFRFGRPSEAPSVKHSVGQFGIGMKRALFKLGKKFTVFSNTKSSKFTVEVDVEKWAALKEWEFVFSNLDQKAQVPDDELGTTIEVSLLRPDVEAEFSLENFKIQLRNELKARLRDPIAKGYAITLNGLPIDAEPLTFLENAQLTPARKTFEFKPDKSKPVHVELYCGLGKSHDRDAAGWHVFCNGRLILEGDKSEVTGWGYESGGLKIPGFHNQYNHLRGYVYFDSDDAGKLPWNTTKTGINLDSPVYRAALLEMVKLMRPVCDFLNKLKEEKEHIMDDGIVGPLEKLVEKSSEKPVESVKTRPMFELPIIKTAEPKKGPVLQRIQYDKPVSEVDAVKRALKVRSFKEVGELTFEYYYNAECEK